jgi:hypothetical protein
VRVLLEFNRAPRERTGHELIPLKLLRGSYTPRVVSMKPVVILVWTQWHGAENKKPGGNWAFKAGCELVQLPRQNLGDSHPQGYVKTAIGRSNGGYSRSTERLKMAAWPSCDSNVTVSAVLLPSVSVLLVVKMREFACLAD